MSDRPRIYLAGHCLTPWRAPVARRLEAAGYEVLCPMEGEAGGQTGIPPEHYMVRDLMLLYRADMILAVLDGTYQPHPYIGTCTEIGLAKGRGKLLLMVYAFPPNRHYGFPVNLADMVYGTLEDALVALEAATQPNAWRKERADGHSRGA